LSTLLATGYKAVEVVSHFLLEKIPTKREHLSKNRSSSRWQQVLMPYAVTIM